MPIQDYWCVKCSKAYEVIVPLRETNKTIRCPHCKEPLRKHISAPKIIRIN